jgi:hypothetical protein
MPAHHPDRLDQCLALRGDTTALLTKLVNPATRGRLTGIQRPAGLGMAIALVQNQGRRLTIAS